MNNDHIDNLTEEMNESVAIRKFCPLAGNIYRNCQEDCAWYDEEKNKCAILVIAENNANK